MPEPPESLNLSFFADAFRNSPAPTIILSADGLVQFWNSAAERIFGWTSEEAMGKPLPFIPAEKSAEHRQMRKQDLQGQGFIGRRISRLRKDGTTVHLSVSTSPIRDADGRVTGIISVYTDITAEKLAEEALLQRQETAERQIDELGELTSQLKRQESDLRLVINGMPGLVSYIDREYRYRFTNRGYSEWLRIPPHEFAGRTITEVAGPDWFEAIRPQMNRALAGELVEFERHIQYLDGQWRDVHATYVPDRGDDGEVRGIVVLVRDITEQKRAEQSLRESEERFRRMVEIAAEGIWIVDPQTRTTFVNQRMADILGYTPEEMMGRSFTDFLHPEDHARGYEGFERRIGGDQGPKEYRGRRKDGATVWLDYTATPMRDAAGQLTGILAMCTDVTERKRADRQLRQTQKLESLGILAGGIAHDFNNLLVGIMGNASLALETLQPGDPAGRMLDEAIAASERAAQLTRQLLAYAGKDHRITAPSSLTALVRELDPLLRTSIPKLVRIVLDLAEDLPPVNADPAQLQQVAMNLVINAAEAIPERTAGTVTVRTGKRRLTPEDHRLAVIPIEDSHGEYVELSVRDTGAGMDLATQARIFDPFFTTKFTGRGLGLSAVLGIVRGHRGTITLQSAPGQGTCFTVLLPAVSPAEKLPGVAAPISDELPRGTGTILIVDDESAVRDVAQRTLERFGYQVLLAENGLVAVDQVKAHPEIRAVLLDLAMPEMSGDAAATAIRALRPELPIVLSSGYSEIEATQLFSATVYAAFLRKPYNTRTLLQKLAQALA